MQYFPPTNINVTSVSFDSIGKFQLIGMEGFSSFPSQPTTSRGPFQPGETLLDNVIRGKGLSVQVVVWGDNREDYWTQRGILAEALSVASQEDQSLAEPGTLRIFREGKDPTDILVVPVQSPSFGAGGPLFTPADIEFFASSPFFTATFASQAVLVSEGGLEIPESGIEILETGIEIPLNLGRVEINNTGDSLTPVSIRIFGEVDTPRITLEETGEFLETTGVIADGDFIRINTEFGKKEVTLVSGGVESNAFDRLNTASQFFQLRPGTNTLIFSFNTNTSGSAEIQWRFRFAGI